MFFMKLLFITFFVILSSHTYAQQETFDKNSAKNIYKTTGYLLNDNDKWFVTVSEESLPIPLREFSMIYGPDGEVFRTPLPSRLSGYPVINIQLGGNISDEGGYHVREAQIPCY